MNIGIVGCGYVADFYMATLPSHPELKLLGVMDRDSARADHFSHFHKVPKVDSLAALLEDERIDLILNLTNPRSHYEVSKAALEKGKHVYSEKPLAMDMTQAHELVALADARRLLISSAPCSLLGESAQTVWRALRNNAIGKVRVVYAEMDDDMIHLMAHDKWRSASGIPWPSKDEFEIGCTLEHAGYYLAWLVAFFGPAVNVTSFASIQVDDEDKLPGEQLNLQSPDFSVACIQFSSGVVARLTCSILAPHNHSLNIIGDDGVLSTADSWHYRSPVHSRKRKKVLRKTFLSPLKTKHALPRTPYPTPKNQKSHSMDFSRGPAEMAEAIRDQRACRLSNQYSLHINELVLATHLAREQGCAYKMTTTFDPIEPMDWAK